MGTRSLNGWQVTSARNGAPAPVEPTGFDLLLRKLGLQEQTAHKHPKVKAWVRDNYRRRFVPEDVLDALHITDQLAQWRS